ncbi:hypothetical protein B0J13DRAFT_626920 [Dactylonectria estremocensis]|uniref:Uncharacterized protein n=1 Tax=Dactylonectria estremocensis TaxID=1079267 RepID=A0A9P9E2Y4_9HYPO|nr:hypothetical protein B0J13DRAFT_626920 [Dactylonectria estremocensis]
MRIALFLSGLQAAIGVASLSTPDVGLAGWTPNTGSACKLECRNRVPLRQCSANNGCRMTQYGCLDRKGNSCGETVHRGTLCVVYGDCSAGPYGCRDDATGEDDGLPAGEHKGHCPGPMQNCNRCREDYELNCDDKEQYEICDDICGHVCPSTNECKQCQVDRDLECDDPGYYNLCKYFCGDVCPELKKPSDEL